MGHNERIYIVRIYRQNDTNPSEMIGIVEDCSEDKKTAFKTFDELLYFISLITSEKQVRLVKRIVHSNLA